MRFWREEDSKVRREERELQFEMFRITLLHNFATSFFTVTMAIGISWIAAMLTISYIPDIPVETKASVFTSALNMLIVWIIVTFIFIGFSLWYIQKKQVGKLRKLYLTRKEERQI